MQPKIKITIEDTNQEVEIDALSNLSKSLDATNSPVLFGCRTGICGTCLVRIVEGTENVEEASDDEKEYLEIVTEDLRDRLACQLKCTGNIKVKYLGK